MPRRARPCRRHSPTSSASTSSARSKNTKWQIKGPKGAAMILGLKPATLYGRMKKLGITRPDEHP